MGNPVKRMLDLSDHREQSFNQMYLFPDGKEKDIQNFFETNNSFGNDVSHAEIWVDDDRGLLLEIRLLTEKGVELSHSKRIENDRLTYWRHEFHGRELDYDPDPLEPSLRKFLEYFYADIQQTLGTLYSELLLPIVFYELYNTTNIKTVRYALSIDKLHQPLIYISFTREGFMLSISDFQSVTSKHVAFATTENQMSYLVQRFPREGSEDLHKQVEVDKMKVKSVIFKGFRDYEVLYYSSPETEREFFKYGFFIDDLRSIIHETEIFLKYIPTVNYHLIRPCNMKCRHCFSDFAEMEFGKLPFEDAIQLIDEIASVKSFKKLNFSGGEPTLFPGIAKLIRHAKELGLETSMITNGFLLADKPELLNERIPSATSILPDNITLANLRAKITHDNTRQKSKDGGHRRRLAGEWYEPVGLRSAS